MQIMLNVPQILAWHVRPCNMSLYHICLSFGPSQTELWVKEVREFSILLHREIGWWTFFCSSTGQLQYKIYRNFLNFEQL